MRKQKIKEIQPGKDMKMMLVVRKDLGMGAGKIAAQCCHAAIGVYKKALRTQPKAVEAWEKDGYYKKIAVRCNSEEELFEVAKKAQQESVPYYIVKDAGLTQIQSGSNTVCGLGPAPDSILKSMTGHLKLL